MTLAHQLTVAATLAAVVPAMARADDDATLSILAWNVEMLPTFVLDAGQWPRAAVIPLLTRGHDVVVLSEAFDDDVREHLVRSLARDYPHATRVVGDRTGWLVQDGGVVVLSRWPIVATHEVVYAHRKGIDRLARKGAVHVCIDKGQRRWHVVGTHTQSGADARAVTVRAAQLAELRTFVDRLAIPPTEPLLFAGDLNIDRTLDGAGRPAGELACALRLLDADLPPVTGLDATYDARNNALAEDEVAFLDYVLVSRRHARPTSTLLEARRARSPVPLRLGRRLVGHELSDHEPVIGTVRLGPALGLTSALSSAAASP